MTEPEVGRAFLAVVPPEDVLDAVGAAAATIDVPSTARRTSRPQWHLTLQFLGNRVEFAAVADALEPLAVELAARRFSEEAGSAASASLARYVEARRRGDAGEIWTAHTAFHFALYAEAGSRWLLRLITPLWETSERYRRASPDVQRSLSERQTEHEAILEACIRRKPKVAAAAMWNHLALTANLLAGAMGGGELFPRR